ncbi:M20 family metallopeptidase [Membranihabitans marinus]
MTFNLSVFGQNYNVNTDYINQMYPQWEALYKDLHQHPELSMQEMKTSKLMGQLLKEKGFEVNDGFGAYNLAAVYKNGPGPVVLIRADMDALPIEEQTNLPYASKAKGINAAGQEVSVMHACGHDIHMTVFQGVANYLTQHKDDWKGTLIMVAQSAEESGLGADLFFKNGLYDKLPKPDYALALHCNSYLEAGKVGYRSGPMMASVDMIDVTVLGKGGHGAAPHTTVDPIVLSSQLIQAFQTIVSRSVNPIEPAVVTVGSIHGGSVHNVIPDEVKMELTVRAYSPEVRNLIIDRIHILCRQLGLAAGLTEDLLPRIEIREPITPATINDEKLVSKLLPVFQNTFGESNVEEMPQYTVGEDFSRFGMQDHHVPICLFWLGTVDPAKMDMGQLPSLHSPFFAPLPEPSIKTGVAAMSAAAVELFNQQ